MKPARSKQFIQRAEALPRQSLALGELAIGREACARPQDHSAVRLWLRLLSCSVQIEREIAARLKRGFGISLARFDYLAQLERHPQGVPMKVLTRYLMVSGGNVTGLTDQLVREGWVERQDHPDDRRSMLVRLTPEGRNRFLAMAAEHESWLVSLFDGFDQTQREQLHTLLGRLRVHVADEPNRPSIRRKNSLAQPVTDAAPS